MKLLFDQNLSLRLVSALADLFPASHHVEDKGLGSATDRAVWNYAQANNFVIVTKDSDFNELSLLLGYPPKIIWIRREIVLLKKLKSFSGQILQLFKNLK